MSQQQEILSLTDRFTQNGPCQALQWENTIAPLRGGGHA